MLIGVPREIKVHEYRVGLTPASVRELVCRGHRVVIESGAGLGVGAPDSTYREAGARLVDSAAEVFATAEMVVKVKEPIGAERTLLRPGQMLFTYLHLAPDPALCRDLLASGAVCIAYETVTAPGGGLPLLAPMSAVAGRMATQVGAACLERSRGGMGVLLGGVPGVAPATVVILGAGAVGTHAAAVAAGMGARVVVLDQAIGALRQIESRFGVRVATAYADRDSIGDWVSQADLLIGAVLDPGGITPRLVERAQVARMRPGAAIVDVAIDQGGCVETSRLTTHAEPTFIADGVVHYGVPNMPGAVPRTSTQALNHATLPYVLTLADQGWRRAMTDDAHLRAGLNLARGKVVNAAVARSLGMLAVPVGDVLAGA